MAIETERTRGDDWDLEFDLTQTDELNATEAMDLTGATVKSSLNTKPAAEGLVTVIDAVAGHIRVSFSHDTTEEIKPSTYTGDVEVTTSGGKVITPLQYKLKVIDDITKPA